MLIRAFVGFSGMVLAVSSASAQDLFASDYNANRVVRYNSSTGAYVGIFASGSGLGLPDGISFLPNGNLMVTSKTNNRLLEFAGDTGAFVRIICSPPAPEDAQIGPDGLIYTSTFNSTIIRRYNPITGAFVDNFGNASPITNPVNMQFGPDGNLYVCGFNSGTVVRLDGRTGARLDTFIVSGAGGISGLEGLAWGPDNNLYVASRNNGRIIAFNGRTGQPTGWVAQLPTTSTQGVAFLCNGNLVASTFASGNVYEIDRQTGAVVRTFANPGGNRASGLLARPALPRVIQSPVSLSVCRNGRVSLSVVVQSLGEVSYLWRRNGVPIDPAAVPSAATATLALDQVQVGDAGTYDVLVSNACGQTTSLPAVLTVTTACTPADIVSIGGVALPNSRSCPDGRLTGDDFNAFINAFVAGELLADIVGIGGSSPPDGLLTGDDFNAFVAGFAAGCP